MCTHCGLVPNKQRRMYAAVGPLHVLGSTSDYADSVNIPRSINQGLLCNVLRPLSSSYTIRPSRGTKFSARTNADKEIFIFPVQLTSCRIGNLTRLIHALVICMCDHTICICSLYYGCLRLTCYLSAVIPSKTIMGKHN